MPAHPSTVFELRQYGLHPGRREELIELFERELVHTQEALGIEVIGPFGDLDRADRFVWLRGFPSVAARAPALAAFYGGPAWQAHRDAANATMTEWHDVLQLKPVRGGFAWGHPAPRLLHATLLPLHTLADEALAAALDGLLQALLVAAGARCFASLVTEPAPNAYPRLPLREGEPMFVCFHEPAPLALPDAWKEHMSGPSQTLRLAPTERAAARLTGAPA